MTTPKGLSCCFRQWRATHSHCRLVHGYALAFKFVFATHELDERNWCFDFGGLKPVRAWLHEMFDHTMIVAEDDPHLASFRGLHEQGLVDLRVLPAVGCEAVARYMFDYVARVRQDRRPTAASGSKASRSGSMAAIPPSTRRSAAGSCRRFELHRLPQGGQLQSNPDTAVLVDRRAMRRTRARA